MKRRNFLKALPAAALTLAGCGQHKTAPANTASLVFDHSYPLDYATQFSADCYEGGYVMIDIPDAGRFLVVPARAGRGGPPSRPQGGPPRWTTCPKMSWCCASRWIIFISSPPR